MYTKTMYQGIFLIGYSFSRAERLSSFYRFRPRTNEFNTSIPHHSTEIVKFDMLIVFDHPVNEMVLSGVVSTFLSFSGINNKRK